MNERREPWQEDPDAWKPDDDRDRGPSPEALEFLAAIRELEAALLRMAASFRRAADGMKAAADAMPPAHPNCRCELVPSDLRRADDRRAVERLIEELRRG